MKQKNLTKIPILDERAFFTLLDDFISDTANGKRRRPDGQKITEGTVRNYRCLQNNLIGFSKNRSFEIKLYIVDHIQQIDRHEVKRHMMKFYDSFTSYLYNDKNLYDNYVGLLIRILIAFLNYIRKDRLYDIGEYHLGYYRPYEEVPIVVMNIDQLHHLLYDPEVNKTLLASNLIEVRDMFVFGCTVALRYSDLFRLKSHNIHRMPTGSYLRVKSKKTGVYTKIKLPDYCMDILNRITGSRSYIFPYYSLSFFNLKLKKLGRLLPENYNLIKTREQKGKLKEKHSRFNRKRSFRLSDHLSSHTMRRTAITLMLTRGVPEHIVRRISGHAHNSREFFRYIKLSQEIIDDATDQAFNDLNRNGD